MQVSSFAAKPFIQRALQNPRSPSSVISFYYGVDYDSSQGRNELEEGSSCLYSMANLWFGGDAEYDKLCAPFAPLVREAGQGKLVGSQWATDHVDGVIAQLVLCDQISRDVFRGTEEAFAYDETALKHARSLTALVLENNDRGSSISGEDENEPQSSSEQVLLSGTMYPPFLSTTVVGLMHSEDKEDHEHAIQVLEYAKRNSPVALQDWWTNQLSMEMEHKDVIDKFGRYPHRNVAKGRESTMEEKAWLADVDNLPGWAKSQGPQ